MPTDLKFKVKFRVPGYIIYQALSSEDIITRYTQSKTIYPTKEGEEFSLYDGSIKGVVTELVQNIKIVQTWKFPNWGEAAECKYTIKEAKGQECEIQVELKGIPDKDIFNKTIEHDNIQAGFMQQIFDNISKWLGYPQNKDETDSEEED